MSDTQAPAPQDQAIARPAREHVPTLAFQTTVLRSQKLSESFRRLTVGGTDLNDFGTNSHPLDMRIKLLLPSASGFVANDAISGLRPDALTSPADQQGWYQRWLAIDPSERGYMRTYTVRAFREAGHPANQGTDPELDIDFVLHGEVVDGLLRGGPATEYGDRAQAGDQLLLLGPNKALCDASYGGIEFRPGEATRIVLAGDETAVPAICSILESLPEHLSGHALIEVPEASDILEVSTNSEVSVQWLPRGGAEHGSRLREAVSLVVPVPGSGQDAAAEEPEDINVDENILWETGQAQSAPFYAWIAGEAGFVKELRRYLVRDAGIDRKQVAFMGYWRHGKQEN